jgi:hypothetical protein
MAEQTELDKMMDEWANDARIDEIELGRESIKTPMLHAKYVRHLTKNSLRVKRLHGEYDRMRGLKSLWLSGKMSKEELDEQGWKQNLLTIKLKADHEMALAGDPDLIAILMKRAYHEEVVDFCRAVLKELNNRTWQIKTAVDFRRFTEGG